MVARLKRLYLRFKERLFCRHEWRVYPRDERIGYVIQCDNCERVTVEETSFDAIKFLGDRYEKGDRIV